MFCWSTNGNLIECVVRLFIAIEFGNFVYACRVLYIFQYAVDNNQVFDRLCFIHITGLLSILVIMQVDMSLFDHKKKKMKRNTFSFMVAILIVYQKTPLPHPMKCSWYAKCPFPVCHRTFYQSWFFIPVLQFWNKRNIFFSKMMRDIRLLRWIFVFLIMYCFVIYFFQSLIKIKPFYYIYRYVYV